MTQSGFFSPSDTCNLMSSSCPIFCGCLPEISRCDLDVNMILNLLLRVIELGSVAAVSGQGDAPSAMKLIGEISYSVHWEGVFTKAVSVGSEGLSPQRTMVLLRPVVWVGSGPRATPISYFVLWDQTFRTGLFLHIHN